MDGEGYAVPIVLVTESNGFSPDVAERLRALAELRLEHGMGRARLLEAVSDVDALWVRLDHTIDSEVIEAAPKLRVIATATTGTDHIAVGEAEKRGIEVISLRSQTSRLREVRATAEHTVAMILMLMRHIPDALSHVEAGGWDRSSFWGRELFEKNVGVVGYGRLGRLVAGYVRAMGAHVAASDPFVEDELIERDGCRPCGLDELLGTADVVTLHARLDADTAGLMGERELALMRSSAWLVNTARGALVDEDALLEALDRRALAGAALDVLRDEHGDGSTRLLRYARSNANLLITPHIGGATIEARAKTEGLVGDDLVRFLAPRGR